MSSQQIKAYITIRNIDQITRLDSASNEQIVNAYLFTEELAVVASSLIERASQGSMALITGLRGVGKSHLLHLLRVIVTQPEFCQRIQHPIARKRLEQVRNNNLRGFYQTVTINCDVENVEPLKIIEKADALIEQAINVSSQVAIFIDGLSQLLRSPKRSECLKWISHLGNAAKRARIFATLDQELINETPDLLTKHRVNSSSIQIPELSVASIFDQYICIKKPEQRRALGGLFSDLKRAMPHFQWPELEFTALFPLHPRVIRLAPALRAYGRAFSLFGFFYTVAPRAIMRRGFNLVSAVELFEAFEFDLRRNPKIAFLFNTYDQLSDSFVRALPAAQQMYGRMLLRALTLLSLTDSSYTIDEIADSVMLCDDSPPVLFRQSLKSIMDLMAVSAEDRIEVLFSDETRYRLRLVEKEKVDPVAIAAATLADDDSRIVELLLNSGQQHYKEWPLVYEEDTHILARRAEVELLWRGTARRGLLKLGGQSELVPGINGKVYWEWQLSIVSPFSSDLTRETPLRGEALRYWYPAELVADELKLLKRLLILQEQGSELLQRDDLEMELSNLNIQAAQIFSRIYLEMGRIGGATESSARAFSTQEKRLAALIGSTFDDHFKNRFSLHPNFGDLLNERTLKILARGFFYQSEWSRPELKKFLGQFALPLHIVMQIGERFEYSLHSDVPEKSPLGKLFYLLEKAGNQTIKRQQMEEVLRSEPYGLQPPVMLLLVLGAAAAGHIILMDERGEVLLTSAGIRSGSDVASYSQICLPEVLQRQNGNREDVVLKHPTQSLFNQPLETVFQEVVAEALQDIPTPTETKPDPESDEVILEFYQSGFFKRPGATGPKERLIEPLKDEPPTITKIRRGQTKENAATPPPEIDFDDIDISPFTGSYRALILPPEKDPIEDDPIPMVEELLKTPVTSPTTWPGTGPLNPLRAELMAALSAELSEDNIETNPRPAPTGKLTTGQLPPPLLQSTVEKRNTAELATQNLANIENPAEPTVSHPETATTSAAAFWEEIIAEEAAGQNIAETEAETTDSTTTDNLSADENYTDENYQDYSQNDQHSYEQPTNATESVDYQEESQSTNEQVEPQNDVLETSSAGANAAFTSAYTEDEFSFGSLLDPVNPPANEPPTAPQPVAVLATDVETESTSQSTINPTNSSTQFSPQTDHAPNTINKSPSSRPVRPEHSFAGLFDDDEPEPIEQSHPSQPEPQEQSYQQSYEQLEQPVTESTEPEVEQVVEQGIEQEVEQEVEQSIAESASELNAQETTASSFPTATTYQIDQSTEPHTLENNGYFHNTHTDETNPVNEFVPVVEQPIYQSPIADSSPIEALPSQFILETEQITKEIGPPPWTQPGDTKFDFSVEPVENQSIHEEQSDYTSTKPFESAPTETAAVESSVDSWYQHDDTQIDQHSEQTETPMETHNEDPARDELSEESTNESTNELTNESTGPFDSSSDEMYDTLSDTGEDDVDTNRIGSTTLTDEQFASNEQYQQYQQERQELKELQEQIEQLDQQFEPIRGYVGAHPSSTTDKEQTEPPVASPQPLLPRPSVSFSPTSAPRPITTPVIDTDINALIVSRKIENERVANKELPILFQHYVNACQEYQATTPAINQEQFKSVIIRAAQILATESHTREIYCQVEVVRGVVQVSCQAGRASLYQKRPPKRRII